LSFAIEDLLGRALLRPAFDLINMASAASKVLGPALK
jgi:hypothetical protein